MNSEQTSPIRAPVAFAGVASSDFQSSPLGWMGRKMDKLPISDWELELFHKLEGRERRSCIKAPLDIRSLPDFLNKAPSYLSRARELGNNMFRMSIDPARICRDEHGFDEGMMSRYAQILAGCRIRGLEPMLVFHHFTMPLSLAQIDGNELIAKGGWEHPDANRYLRRFAQRVLGFLSDKGKIDGILKELGVPGAEREKLICQGLVRHFMSLNEPIMTPLAGYMSGMFPPFKQGRLIAAYKVLGKMIEAHEMFHGAVKAYGSRFDECDAQIGVGYNWQDSSGTARMMPWANEWYARKFEREGRFSDFIGEHYYFRSKGLFAKIAPKDRSEHPGFREVYPSGIGNVLRHMHTAFPGKDIFVTEFGFAERNDLKRPFWIMETLRHILAAAKEGVPIRGVLLWTMVDNFEWDLGMSQRFGLFREEELDIPLERSKKEAGGKIRSWEAWQAGTDLLLRPGTVSSAAFDSLHARAKAQFENA